MKNLSSDIKKYNTKCSFKNYNLTPLDIYNGSSQVYWIKPVGRTPLAYKTCADPGIFVSGVQVNLTKKLWRCFFVFLVLILFYWSQMVIFEENYHFQGSRGGLTFSRGGGGGSNCLFPIETHKREWPPAPTPPLDPHLQKLWCLNESSTICHSIALSLTLYSIKAPFDTLKISCIWKYYGKWSICSFWSKSSIFHNIFKCLKLNLNFSWIFFNVV